LWLTECGKEALHEYIQSHVVAVDYVVSETAVGQKDKLSKSVSVRNGFKKSRGKITSKYYFVFQNLG
jgi:hypothetical protein